MKEYDGYGAIYALIDPKTNKVRYIGKTTTKLAYRLKSHLNEKYLMKHTHKNTWIKKLLRTNTVPIIKLLAVASNSKNLDMLEKSYITQYLNLGAKLTNATRGGDGWPKGVPIPGGAKKAHEAIKRKITAINIITGEKHIFNSVKEAAEELNTSTVQIILVAKKRLYTCEGFYIHYSEESFTPFHLPYRKAIYRIDPITNDKVLFDYAWGLQEKGYDSSSIIKCCKGKRQLHKGYRWQYAE